ncbi:MAG TPA: hypothetical protein VJK48_04425 [Chlamydiales bacterium]|nr:hypothetical protein [Chlamydiales bacterium]
MRYVVALFGESEKGQFKKGYALRELPQLIDVLGSPPPESEGLFFAIQALLYKREVLYFRVMEEGFSRIDYFYGLKALREVHQLDAICLPGVGDSEIIAASQDLCLLHRSHLIATQKDLYDYLTLSEG